MKQQLWDIIVEVPGGKYQNNILKNLVLGFLKR